MWGWSRSGLACCLRRERGSALRAGALLVLSGPEALGVVGLASQVIAYARPMR